jgi:hypothetical protein
MSSERPTDPLTAAARELTSSQRGGFYRYAAKQFELWEPDSERMANVWWAIAEAMRLAEIAEMRTLHEYEDTWREAKDAAEQAHGIAHLAGKWDDFDAGR